MKHYQAARTPALPLGLKRTDDTGGDSLSNRVLRQWPVCAAINGDRGAHWVMLVRNEGA